MAEHWNEEKLAETLKVLWNEVASPDEQLNFRDDHVVSWYFSSLQTGRATREWPLYIQVLHLGMDRYWGNRQTEILCRVLTEIGARKLLEAYPPANNRGTKIRWDASLPNRYAVQMDDRRPGGEMPSNSWIPRNYSVGKPNEHQISFGEIWNPGSQLGYGWRCSCEKGMMCTAVGDRLHRNFAAQDVHAKLKQSSMFTVAIPILSRILHRVTIAYMTGASSWDGTPVDEIQVIIPTGLGEQIRYYQMDDWLTRAVNPLEEVIHLLVSDMLGGTAEGQAHAKMSESYATGAFRSTICSYKKHGYGQNDALRRLLQNESPRGQVILANAFCMLHLNMCLVCATNNELALMVPSQV